MPKASRYLREGYTFHLTHRCHDRRFLLKFAKDRDVYREWLRVAIKRMIYQLGRFMRSLCLTTQFQGQNKASKVIFRQDISLNPLRLNDLMWRSHARTRFNFYHGQLAVSSGTPKIFWVPGSVENSWFLVGFDASALFCLTKPVIMYILSVK